MIGYLIASYFILARGYITYSREMDEGSRCSSGSTAGELLPGNNDRNDISSMMEGRDEERHEGRHKGKKEGKYDAREEGRQGGRDDGRDEGRQVLQDDGLSQRHVHFKKNSEEDVSGSGLKNVTEDVIRNEENSVRNEKQLKRKDVVQNHGEMTETYLTELPQTSLEQQSNKDNSRSKETLQCSQNTTTLNGNGNLLEFAAEKNAIPSTSQQETETKPATQYTEDKQGFDGDYVNQR